MKSQIWRLAGVSVLSLAMCANTLADDMPQGRSDMGGGGPQRDQGRGNQGGGQQNPRPPQQQPQAPVRQSDTGRAAQRERDAAVQKQSERRAFTENYNGGQIPSSQTGGSSQPPGNHGGHNGGGSNQGGGNQGGYGQHNGGYGNGYGGGYNGGNNNGWRGDGDDSQRPRPGGGQQWSGGGNSSGGKPPPGNQWNGGRPGGGWGPGPRWEPGYRVNTIPQGRWRVPHGGIDYYYAEGYWYRPYGPSYIVVTPPYGVRVRTLPSYAEQLWIGSALYFIAAGTYYLYEANRQEYVVTNPPVQVTSNNGWQGNGYDVVAYPANGQSQAQMAQDRYDCHRWAVNQSGFDPSQATYAPTQNVADIYRRSLGACLAGRGYSVN